MTPLDIQSEEKWREMLGKLVENTGMDITLTNAEGGHIVAIGDRNPICNKVRENPDSLKFICSQTAAAMTAELKIELEPMVDYCEAGLLRLAVPLVKDGALIGQITGCGLTDSREEIDPFMLSKQTGAEEGEIEELRKGVVLVEEGELLKVGEDLFKDLKSL